MIRIAMTRLALFGALAASLAVARPVLAGNADAEAAIAALDDKVGASLTAKDAETLSGYYAPDAVFAASGLGSLKGREAIKAGFAELFKDPNVSGKETSRAFSAADGGDVGYLIATYEFSMTSPETNAKTTATGTNVTLYRKDESGAWMIVSDMNVDDPAAH